MGINGINCQLGSKLWIDELHTGAVIKVEERNWREPLAKALAYNYLSVNSCFALVHIM